MTDTPTPAVLPDARAREVLAAAYERANLVCPASDVRAGNKIDWVRESVALDAIAEALATHSPAPMAGEVEQLRDALVDLVSWFPESGPTDYGPWIIKAGPHGADDAIAAARAAAHPSTQEGSR